MNMDTRSLSRWSLIMGYMGIVCIVLSCSAIGLGSANVAQGILQLDDGVVKVQNENGDWEPMAGESTFELSGALENIEPWQVAGRTLQTNAATQIAQDLEVGDLVRVRGAVLDDDTWLAYSIEPVPEVPNQTLILVGRVSTVNPWVVNGITLIVTDDTVITGDIKPGMLVRVELLLLEDGTWEVISIAPLGDLIPTDNCVNVIATVVSVTGSEVQFLGWPKTVKLDDSPDTGTDTAEADDVITLQPGQQVLAVICLSEDGQLIIVKVTVLDADDGDDTSTGGEKVLVCHKPDKKGGHTLSIASPAVPAHLAHGDRLGACP
jgi:hypothetical protein